VPYRRKGPQTRNENLKRRKGREGGGFTWKRLPEQKKAQPEALLVLEEGKTKLVLERKSRRNQEKQRIEKKNRPRRRLRKQNANFCIKTEGVT